jgi:Tfp pilus assembly protein FimV
MDVNRLPIALSSAFAIFLAVAAGPVAALGLGQIRVKSQPGQPLLAEIPIISTDPSELQGLQVQLAASGLNPRRGLSPRCVSSPRWTLADIRSSASPAPQRCSSRC